MVHLPISVKLIEFFTNSLSRFAKIVGYSLPSNVKADKREFILKQASHVHMQSSIYYRKICIIE